VNIKDVFSYIWVNNAQSIEELNNSEKILFKPIHKTSDKSEFISGRYPINEVKKYIRIGAINNAIQTAKEAGIDANLLAEETIQNLRD
jgi:hypothetical protein